MTHPRVTCQKNLLRIFKSLIVEQKMPRMLQKLTWSHFSTRWSIEQIQRDSISGASRANETQLAQSKTVPPVNSGFLLSKPSYGPPISFYSRFEKREVTKFQLLKLYKFCSKYAACYTVRLSESLRS